MADAASRHNTLCNLSTFKPHRKLISVVARSVHLESPLSLQPTKQRCRPHFADLVRYDSNSNTMLQLFHV